MLGNRIVTIHAVSDGTFKPCRLEKYIKIMRFLRYDFVSLNEILKQRGRHRLIALTFDDGYSSTFKNAIPILKKYKVPALMFVPTGLLGCSANQTTLLKHECYKNEATMSITEVNQWIDEGFEIGFHTHMHIDLFEASDQEIGNDMAEGLDFMNKEGWKTVFFAYPKGYLPKNRHLFEDILKRNNIDYAFTINHGDLNTEQPYYINRVCLGNKEPFIWSILKTLGVIGDWYFNNKQKKTQQQL